MRVSRALCLACSLPALALVHCSSSPTPCFEDSACLAAANEAGAPDVFVGPGPDGGDGSTTTGGDSGDADSGGDGGTVKVPPGCDPTADAKDQPACVDDAFAVFVNTASGNDAAVGTKAAPFKTITTAVSKLGAKSRVYVCEGSYAEKLVITKPITIAGGFACTGWAYTGTKSKIAPSSKGYGLQVTDANGAVFSDLDIKVLDASDPGESSIAIFISGSTAQLSRVSAQSGLGIKGADQSQVATASKASKGATSLGDNGADGGKNSCPDGDSAGGSGATVAGLDATAGTPTLSGGQPGMTNKSCLGPGTPGSGKPGSPGGPGKAALKSTALGQLDASGWKPSSGGPGVAGARGQGGGGGGAQQGGGGGGGAGGCGGAGGLGGGGGGASIALLVFDSTVDLRSSALSSGSAGAGGKGAAGQLGQPAGSGGGGGPGTDTDGCDGAEGGAGGAGGGGAGGAGGVASAIVFGGKAPAPDAQTTLIPGTAGTAGPGGGTGNDGPAGQSAASTSVP